MILLRRKEGRKEGMNDHVNFPFQLLDGVRGIKDIQVDVDDLKSM